MIYQSTLYETGARGESLTVVSNIDGTLDIDTEEISGATAVLTEQQVRELRDTLTAWLDRSTSQRIAETEAFLALEQDRLAHCAAHFPKWWAIESHAEHLVRIATIEAHLAKLRTPTI